MYHRTKDVCIHVPSYIPVVGGSEGCLSYRWLLAGKTSWFPGDQREREGGRERGREGKGRGGRESGGKD